MKTKYRAKRSERLRHYHFREGASKRSSLALPSFLTGIVLLAFGFAISQVDIKQLVADRYQKDDVVVSLQKDQEVTALEQSIGRASELNQQDESLTEAIKDQIDNYPKDQEWSVYVNDLNGSMSASVNADKTFLSGSLYKLFLLAPLETKISVDQWDYHWDSGQNVGYCVEASLGSEDDACSEHLGNYVNWNYINDYNQKIGLKDTNILEDTDKSQTNAKEVGQLLTQLKTSQIMSDMGRRNVFDVLYYQDYKRGIPMACDDCVVANKSSEQGQYVHDAGIVTRGQKSYVVVIMSKGGTSKQITHLTRTIDKQLNP